MSPSSAPLSFCCFLLRLGFAVLAALKVGGGGAAGGGGGGGGGMSHSDGESADKVTFDGHLVSLVLVGQGNMQEPPATWYDHKGLQIL